ncbi:7,8-dihydro-8-oxoguanine triphosphatase [Reticulibacter mediterranei]|uniref:7,8-dihydro-8-oxoguanine triphosphatase n=1 Tax=Reticulibacter mediterranei TaxID=2778369 RepID=A0A8J3IXK3_9CHLR|nr:NUDIX domain-containing protein [Reticulibacter mediterranei]GHO97116.1 7,8-dihydro-8-oxoguanine triphosphatase [Reticulibacter mediterranei]
MELPYTICFCCHREQVLLLYRTFPPNAQLWNGLGGKIETGETPLASVQREVQEEAGIDLREAPSLFFAGIVTWGLVGHEPAQGMYAFIAHLSAQQAKQAYSQQTPEGLLTWKSLAWACHPNNLEVVSNIPQFLPSMLEAQYPSEYFYEYTREDLSVTSFQRLVIRPLPAHLKHAW